jgi:hypothetical protein
VLRFIIEIPDSRGRLTTAFLKDNISQKSYIRALMANCPNSRQLLLAATLLPAKISFHCEERFSLARSVARIQTGHGCIFFNIQPHNSR